jgi:hypothetical protein
MVVVALQIKAVMAKVVAAALAVKTVSLQFKVIPKTAALAVTTVVVVVAEPVMVDKAIAAV